MTSNLDDKKDSPHDISIAQGVIHVHFSEEEERKVVRKIDFVILPMVWTLEIFIGPALIDFVTAAMYSLLFPV